MQAWHDAYTMRQRAGEIAVKPYRPAAPSRADRRSPLDATFAGLADPARRAILARLACGEASVTEPAKPFATSQLAISKRLEVLEPKLGTTIDWRELTGA
jgi:DNA-binding transcriptional ArsR family regulator